MLPLIRLELANIQFVITIFHAYPFESEYTQDDIVQFQLLIFKTQVSQFLIYKQYCIVQMDHIFCTHYSVLEHLSSFQLLAITNKASVNIGEHVPLWHCWISFGFMLKRVIAGTSGIYISNFMKNLQSDFQNGFTSLQSHQQWRSVLISPHPNQHVLALSFLLQPICMV